jgi:hypothetical protein
MKSVTSFLKMREELSGFLAKERSSHEASGFVVERYSLLGGVCGCAAVGIS